MDKRQLCAALHCVAWQHPARFLPRRTALILKKKNQLFSTKAQRVAKKNASLGKYGYAENGLPWQLIRSGTIYPNKVFSTVYTKTLIVSFPYHLHCQKFADTDRLRVNKTSTVLSLHTRLGGLGLPCLSGKKSRMAQREFDISVSVTTTLTSLVLEQKSSLGSAPELQQRLKAAALRQKTTSLQAFANSVVEHLPAQGQRAVQLACEKGSSSWLNALSLVEHGFDLSKSAFRDAVSLRYGWEIKNLPSTCVVRHTSPEFPKQNLKSS